MSVLTALWRRNPWLIAGFVFGVIAKLAPQEYSHALIQGIGSILIATLVACFFIEALLKISTYALRRNIIVFIVSVILAYFILGMVGL
jgi:uncharacterized protein YacL